MNIFEDKSLRRVDRLRVSIWLREVMCEVQGERTRPQVPQAKVIETGVGGGGVKPQTFRG